jgi:hypothetical protein
MQLSRRLLSLSFSLLFCAFAAHGQIYQATLSGANENPPTASAGVGSTTVTLDTRLHTLRVVASFSGLTGNTTVAHIHCCITAPGNVGVATMTPTFVGFPVGVTSGTYDQTFDTTLASTWNAAFITNNGGTPAGAEARLANGLATGQAYLNIHSSVFTGGEIRGFLQAPPVATPALGSWALLLLILLLPIAVSAKHHRRSNTI